MSEIKWIKITTDMFDDEKIKLIEAMPEADMILIIWIKLLTLAGKKNVNGYIFLTENIPYTDEMLATIFNRPVNTIRLALDVFKKFNMIEYDGNNNLKITNWGKHQNIEGLEKIREQNRLRVQKYRERIKQIEEPQDCNVTETLRNDIDKNRLDKNRLDKNIYPFTDIVNYLNIKTSKSFRHTTKKTQSLIRARINEGFTLDDFKKVIDTKTAEWRGKKTKEGANMEDYLRPETLFGTKFESYLNQQNADKQYGILSVSDFSKGDEKK